MELQNSKEKLGEYINKNMDLDTMKDKLTKIGEKKPEMLGTVNGFLDKISVLSAALSVNKELFSKIEIMKSNLKKLKSTLNLAQKAYNLGNKGASIALDLKPAVNGSPPATGASAVLTPLEVAVSKTTDSITELENQIDSETAKLNEEAKKNIDKVKDLTANIVSKLLS